MLVFTLIPPLLWPPFIILRDMKCLKCATKFEMFYQLGHDNTGIVRQKQK